MFKLWPHKQEQTREQKQGTMRTMVARIVMGQAQWPDRDARMLADEGYRKNVIAYRCIRMIAESAASVPIDLFRREKQVDTHDLLDLLANPNPDQSGVDLMDAFYSFLMISGNSYVERINGMGAIPRELYTLRPDRVKIVPGPDGFVEAWDFTVGGTTRRIPADNSAPGRQPVMHMKMFHPLDDFFGMSPLDPSAWGIDTHSAASTYNKSLLDNSAVPSGALIVKDGADGEPRNLTDEERDALDGQLQARYSGPDNAGRPMILDGGVEWKSIAQTAKEMQTDEVKQDAARDIARGLGVPPMLLGIPGDNTYANYTEANRAFWRQTVLPLVDRGAKAFSHWLCPAYSRGAGLRLVPNIDNLDALAADRAAQWDRVNNADFLTINEKREATGYEPIPGGDFLAMPANEELVDPETGQRQADPGTEDPADKSEDDDKAKDAKNEE